MAAEKLGKSATASIVFEDSPSGLGAGQRARCRTIAITAALLEPQELNKDFRANQIEYDSLADELILTISSERLSAV